ncbi:MAG: RlmE family RNA methyltransferase [Candidatus Heimdallarchaeaceae archaeon]|nr:MAG: RlmE family RNA methyltransferase [Candidatus Pacearchaeota archaeon]
MPQDSDYFYNKAKKQGYRSRASYKLLQIHEKFHIFKKNQKVVDLGASPGGWTQVASEKVGNNGLVIAIDKAYIPPLNLKNVDILQMDIMNETISEYLKERYGLVDVLLSDCAPNVSGKWSLDHSIQIMLAERAIKIAEDILKDEGWIIVKVFQGEQFTNFVSYSKKVFTTVKLFKPQASRKKSAEIYLIANTKS